MSEHNMDDVVASMNVEPWADNEDVHRLCEAIRDTGFDCYEIGFAGQYTIEISEDSSGSPDKEDL